MFKVAIIGKPNVGKSTLFNRLAKKHKAITDKTMGITRDRNGVVAEWLTNKFFLFDTGGIIADNTDDLQSSINQQASLAVNEANLIIFLISSKDGIDKNDMYIAKLLKKQKVTKVLLVINKTEANVAGEYYQKSVYSLGFGDPLPIASEHGIGIGDLLDKIVENMHTTKEVNEPEPDVIKFCVLGRPNVGKSTIINALVDQNRVIVSPIEGTTRDAIDVNLRYQNQDYLMIDTAGIKRKGKIDVGVETYAVKRSLVAIKRSDLICFVVDISTPLTEQDEVVGGLANKANIPVIVLANKVDLLKNKNEEIPKIMETFRQKFRFLSYAPIIFVSGLKKQNLDKLFKTIQQIEKEKQIQVATSMLNEVIQKAQTSSNPPMFHGGRIQINYATQIKSQIPSFVLFCNDPKFLHFSYSRYLENQIRMAFGINSVPIMLYFKSKNARDRKKTEV